MYSCLMRRAWYNSKAIMRSLHNNSIFSEVKGNQCLVSVSFDLFVYLPPVNKAVFP